DSDHPLAAEVATAFNAVVRRNDRFAAELARVARSVGVEGRLDDRARLPGAVGTWASSVESVNALVESMAWPIEEVGRVVGALSDGDLTDEMALRRDGAPLCGEYQRIAATVNDLVRQLRAMSSEVTRVAREVGADGKLGVQADVEGA